MHVSGRLYVCVSGRVADKKAAIGFTYEDSTDAGSVGVAKNKDDINDDAASSDEDIDLGQSWSISRFLDFDLWKLGGCSSHLSQGAGAHYVVPTAGHTACQSICLCTYLLTTFVVDNILDLDALTEEQEQVLNMISVEYGMRGMDYSEYVTPLTLSLCLLLVLILCWITVLQSLKHCSSNIDKAHAQAESAARFH